MTSFTRCLGTSLNGLCRDMNMNMNPSWRLPRPSSQLAILRRRNRVIFPCRFPFTPKTSFNRRVSPSPQPFRCLHAMAGSSYLPTENIYHPEVDVEHLEDLCPADTTQLSSETHFIATATPSFTSLGLADIQQFGSPRISNTGATYR